MLIPLELAAAESYVDAGIHKKIFGSRKITLLKSNYEMEDIIKVVKSYEDSGFFLERVSETIQNEAKEQKKGFLIMLLGTLGESVLGNILLDK